MTKVRMTEKIGATPGKLALIAVLAVVLVVVIVRALPNRSGGVAKATTAAPAGRGRATSPVATNSSSNSSSSEETTESEKPWPEVSLQEILAYNPFVRPHWAAAKPLESISDEADSQRAEILARLQQQGAAIVVISGNKKSAAIGSQYFQVGDVIDGYQITDITTEGVILKEHQPQ